MELDDHVIVINRDDPFYGYKFKIGQIIRGLKGEISRYVVHDGYGRHQREYAPTDLQYTTISRRSFTSQMQLF